MKTICKSHPGLKSLLLLLILVSSCLPGAAQKKEVPPRGKFSLGIGLGLDYGGVGCRFTYSPVKQVFTFAAAGYNLDFGYNVGAGYRFTSDKRFSPFIVGMYGYNTVVRVTMTNGWHNSETTTEVFYGPSFGLGFDLRRSRNRKNFWHFAVLVPIRSQAFRDYKTMLEENYNTEVNALPIAISIGYQFGS